MWMARKMFSQCEMKCLTRLRSQLSRVESGEMYRTFFNGFSCCLDLHFPHPFLAQRFIPIWWLPANLFRSFLKNNRVKLEKWWRQVRKGGSIGRRWGRSKLPFKWETRSSENVSYNLWIFKFPSRWWDDVESSRNYLIRISAHFPLSRIVRKELWKFCSTSSISPFSNEQVRER